MTDEPEIEERDIYADDVGPEADAEYTVYVACGDAELKFNQFCKSLGAAIEIEWKDRSWV